MIKNPYLNAFMALGYIALIILIISKTNSIAVNTPDTILAPITMLSLFVLSAAIMGILFVYEPLCLLELHRKFLCSYNNGVGKLRYFKAGKEIGYGD